MHPVIHGAQFAGCGCRSARDRRPELSRALLDRLHLDATHKIILHIGGKYGDAAAALARFASVIAISLRGHPPLVLENDGGIYTIAEVLDLCGRIGAPAVYDNLHNASIRRTDQERRFLGLPLPRHVAPDRWRAENALFPAHPLNRAERTRTPSPSTVLDYCHRLSGELPDIMLEVKDKNAPR